MVGACPDDPLDAAQPRRLVDVAHADDVGVENIFPDTFAGVTAEMENAVDAIDGRAHRIEVGEIR